jgi:hypothetical protein
VNKIWKRSIFIALAFAALMSVHAQNGSNTKSASIRLVAVVPAILRLSLDFSPDGTTQLTGYIPGNEALQAKVAYGHTEGSRFEIKAGAMVNLGNATIFSNIGNSYSVTVFSSNGGSLRDPNFATSASIPYQLLLGGTVATARGGSFSFTRSGKSSNSSAALSVALMITDVPAAAPSGQYTDRLLFSISAN